MHISIASFYQVSSRKYELPIRLYFGRLRLQRIAIFSECPRGAIPDAGTALAMSGPVMDDDITLGPEFRDATTKLVEDP